MVSPGVKRACVFAVKWVRVRHAKPLENELLGHDLMHSIRSKAPSESHRFA